MVNQVCERSEAAASRADGWIEKQRESTSRQEGLFLRPHSHQLMEHGKPGMTVYYLTIVYVCSLLIL